MNGPLLSTSSRPPRYVPPGSSASDGVLLLDRVVRRFGDLVAIDGVSLEILGGQVVGLLGHNGAGKTTTVRLLAGLLVADDGVVRVRGRDPVVDGPVVRQRLGVLPSTPAVDARLTGVQNLRFAADVFDVPTDGLDARIAAALEAFELSDRGDERVAGYSTGMRQRLALARVLLPDPEVLLLDEPTAALDPVAARQVRRILAELAREQRRTIVLCTHDLAEAEVLCDRVVVLEHGRVAADGSPAELAARHGTGGVQLEVAPDRAEEAGQRLARLSVGDVEVEGAGRLRAHGVAREAVPELVRTLVGAGVEVFEVRRRDPTLEDVYLALHGRLPEDDGRQEGGV